MFFSQKRFICLREIACIGLLICMLELHGHAEEKNDFADYPQQVKQYLQCLLGKGQHKYAFRSDYPGGFDAWQRQARPVLRKLVGLDKISEQVGHHVSKVELMQIDDLGEYTRQRGWIETEPHVRIKIWLLKPKRLGPFPLAILPHGHDSRGYDTSAGVTVTSYRAFLNSVKCVMLRAWLPLDIYLLSMEGKIRCTRLRTSIARPGVYKQFTQRQGFRIVLNTDGATKAIDSIRI